MEPQTTPILHPISEIARNLGVLASQLWDLGSSQALILLWIVVWLLAVNWKKLWPVLGRGGWAPLALLCIVSAIVWSQLTPGPCPCGLPAFWWQLAAISGLVLIALVCGWLQGLFQWAPPEIDLNPPVHHHGHHHDHH